VNVVEASRVEQIIALNVDLAKAETDLTERGHPCLHERAARAG
jgi:hypothetical protein